MISEKARVRNEAIDTLVAKAEANEDCTDRMYWTLIHDFEHAPMTTNLAQLEEAGLKWETVDELAIALSKIGIYLLHTNHLTDDELTRRLATVLVEQVRDLPPDATGVYEFIDLLGGDGEAEEEIYQRYYATKAEREQFLKENGYAIDQMVKPNNRDATLPKPQSGAEGRDTQRQTAALALNLNFFSLALGISGAKG